MSQETIQDLNRFQLVSRLTIPGADESYLNKTDRGLVAWHYDLDHQVEDNHYDGFIPLADVERRLFNWEAVQEPLSTVVPWDAPVADGLEVHPEPIFLYGKAYKLVTDPTRQIIVRSDNQTPLGVFRDTYTPHPYKEWLLDNVAVILDEAGKDLGITSAGLLRNGAVAYVQVQPQNGTTIGGDLLVPLLTASGSFDGSLSTSYTAGKYRAVCDNSLSAAIYEAEATGHRAVYQHRGSATLKAAHARETLGLFFEAQDAFDREVEKLQNTTVQEDQFWAIVGQLHEAPKAEATDRVWGNYERKLTTLGTLWSEDDRVAPFTGTAWGAYQALNTYDQHVGGFKRSRDAGSRFERNKLNVVTGSAARSDSDIISTIHKVLQPA